MPRLQEDLHLPAVAFAALHPLQLAGSLSGIAAALCGALLLGTGHADAERPGPRARFLHAPTLVDRPGSLPTGAFLSPPNGRSRRSVANAWGSGRSRSCAFVLADSSSANSLAPASLRNFHGAHHPCLGMLAAFFYVADRGKTTPCARMSKKDRKSTRCSTICGRRIGPVGLPVTAPSSSASVLCTKKRGPRSMSTPA